MYSQPCGIPVQTTTLSTPQMYLSGSPTQISTTSRMPTT